MTQKRLRFLLHPVNIQGIFLLTLFTKIAVGLFDSFDLQALFMHLCKPTFYALLYVVLVSDGCGFTERTKQWVAGCLENHRKVFKSLILNFPDFALYHPVSSAHN